MGEANSSDDTLPAFGPTTTAGDGSGPAKRRSTSSTQFIASDGNRGDRQLPAPHNVRPGEPPLDPAQTDVALPAGEHLTQVASAFLGEPQSGQECERTMPDQPSGDSAAQSTLESGDGDAPPAAQGRPAPAIPGYEIIGELGRGAMGVVYQAVQLRLNRPCALKMILAGAHASPENSVRFLAEAETLAKLQHPNVVQIHHVGEAGGLPFFELEYVDGGSLDRRLDGTPWPARRAAALVESLATGVAEAHRLGIIHRDLKPGNVLLAADGTPKVTDFGLAKSLNLESGLTRTGSVMGSPSYMAPEQAEGRSKAAGTLADVYALGAILYELLTGRPPFKAVTILETLEQVKAMEPVPPSRLVPGVERDVETIALKCLQKDSTKRYGSAAALADDLRRFQAGEPILARRTGPVERVWRWARRNKAVAGLLVTLGVVLAGGLAGMTALWVRSEHHAAIASSNAEKARELARTEAAARATAQAQERIATNRAEDLAQQDYINRVNRAYREVEDDNISLAEDLLHGCPAERRGWEWNYVKRLANLDRLTINIGRRSVEGIAFGPDGSWLVTGSGTPFWMTETSAEPNAEIEIWSSSSGDKRRTLGRLKGVLHGLAISTDGTRVAACGGFALPQLESSLTVWELATGRELWSKSGPGPVARGVAFSPDGKSLAVGTGSITELSPGQVTILDVESGRQLSTPLDVVAGLNKVAFHPDGRRLAVAGDKIVEIWDVASRKKIGVFRGHSRGVYCPAFSPDGRWLATGGMDRTIRIWDVATGYERHTIYGHKGYVMGLAFSPDGSLLASASEDRSAKIWELSSGREKATFHGHKDFVQSVAFRPGGGEIATGSVDGSAKVWNLRTSHPVVFEGHSTWVVRLAVRSDGRRAFSEPWEHLRAKGDGTRIWDPVTGEDDPRLAGTQFKDLGPDYIPGAAEEQVVATSPDGKLVARAVDVGPRRVSFFPGDSVEVRESGSGRVLYTLVGHTSHVMCLMFSPDGRRIVTASDDRTIKMWDTATGLEVFTLRGHTGGLRSVAFSPDGNRILTGAVESTVRVWDGTPLPAALIRAHDAAFQQKLMTISGLK
jgi:eukaryotic-like serine/threonine-protein kinase